MSDERRPEALESLIANLIIPLAGLALTYWVGTHAASIEIEIRGRIRKTRAMLDAWKAGTTAGGKVAEWFVKAEGPRVIAEAESVAERSASGQDWRRSDSDSD